MCFWYVAVYDLWTGIAASAKQNLINATSFVYEDYHIINLGRAVLLVEAARQCAVQQMLSPFWREVVFFRQQYVEVGSWPTKLCNSLLPSLLSTNSSS
jgi:hypothetical protein